MKHCVNLAYVHPQIAQITQIQKDSQLSVVSSQ